MTTSFLSILTGAIMLFKYSALLTRQVENGKFLALFSAPATDIVEWGGIPQKKLFDDGQESVGFQREESSGRLKDISAFLSEPANTIQNPLLCASREFSKSEVNFEELPGASNSESVKIGTITISVPDFKDIPYIELLKMVMGYLETRLPSLKTQLPSETVLTKITSLAREKDLYDCDEEDNEDLLHSPDIEAETSEEASQGLDYVGALFEESHLADFWEELAARKVVLEKINDFRGDDFLGFPREALISYLMPVVIVDGQHRLKGALRAIDDYMDSSSAISQTEKLAAKGLSATEIETALAQKVARSLPISLLVDSDPAEHVFQFVVVNQKATPIGKALLGTIVSTSLSTNELTEVADRLIRARIPLEESRAASFLAKHPSSPFFNLVERGIGGDANTLLPWVVFTALVNVFKQLKGATPYHEKTDYAHSWRANLLDSSPIIEEYEAKGFKSPYEYWSSFDGPWRVVFIKFWTIIRDNFAHKTEKQKRNYWGNPRTSNLFNKISLNILAASFFKYLRNQNLKLESAEDIASIVDAWLTGVEQSYFDREWELEKAGVKKDSRGIRHAWAKIWEEYRGAPDQLPNRNLYKKPTVS